MFNSPNNFTCPLVLLDITCIAKLTLFYSLKANPSLNTCIIIRLISSSLAYIDLPNTFPAVLIRDNKLYAICINSFPRYNVNKLIFRQIYDVFFFLCCSQFKSYWFYVILTMDFYLATFFFNFYCKTFPLSHFFFFFSP